MIFMCIINSQTICDVTLQPSFASLIDKQEQESLSLPVRLSLNAGLLLLLLLLPIKSN